MTKYVKTSDRLARIETKLEAIHDHIIEMKHSELKVESRVRDLEVFKSYTKGAGTFIVAILTAAIGVFMRSADKLL